MNHLKKFIKESFKFAGLELSKIASPPPSPPLHHETAATPPSALSYHKIELLLDVGANVGQFALEKRAEGYKGKIISFEPLPDAYEKLLETSKNDRFWIIHERCAVGSSASEVDINISGNSYSSSILPMLPAHLSAAPESLYIGKAKTKVITLDSVFDEYRVNKEKVFLKIDTQGFEAEVLSGLSRNLRNITAVQLEMSIVPLYENQHLYKYFFEFFEKNGFALWSLIPGFYNPITGQALQFDAVFVKNY